MSMPLYPKLRAYIEALLPALRSIPVARRELLDPLAQFVIAQRAAGEPVQLTFICTHNSRRSHMSQLWAATASAWYGLDIHSYSGGTEATAFNPRAVAAMRRAGFQIDDPGGDNPRYRVSFGPVRPSMLVFSKTWDSSANPTLGFAAVMTCSQADAACPLVSGASSRISLPYADPKADDGTPAEAASYDASALQIAIELFYVFDAAATA